MNQGGRLILQHIEQDKTANHKDNDNIFNITTFFLLVGLLSIDWFLFKFTPTFLVVLVTDTDSPQKRILLAIDAPLPLNCACGCFKQGFTFEKTKITCAGYLVINRL